MTNHSTIHRTIIPTPAKNLDGWRQWIQTGETDDPVVALKVKEWGLVPPSRAAS